jgi:hypothetical protein
MQMPYLLSRVWKTVWSILGVDDKLGGGEREKERKKGKKERSSLTLPGKEGSSAGSDWQ